MNRVRCNRGRFSVLTYLGRKSKNAQLLYNTYDSLRRPTKTFNDADEPQGGDRTKIAYDRVAGYLESNKHMITSSAKVGFTGFVGGSAYKQ